MMLSFLKTRIHAPDHFRPYRVPGNLGVARLLAWGCMAVLSLSMVLFMYTPDEGPQWAVIVGVAVTLVVGEVMIRFTEDNQ